MIIPAVSDGPRPVWSVLIPTYNCARFLGRTLESVLEQDPGPELMEIIVVDDASSDSPGKVVESAGRGRVRFIGREENVGKVRNYESGLLASRGLLIHQLHGDDFVRPGFYDAMKRAFDQFPDAGAFFSSCQYVDETDEVTGAVDPELSSPGLLDDWLAKISTHQHLLTPSMVMRRGVYETLGGFDRRLDAFEDWEMWIRIATRFSVGFVPDATACYRASEANNTIRTLRAGTRFKQLNTMLEIVDNYLPADVLSRIRDERSRGLAQYVTEMIPTLMKHREYTTVPKLYAEALAFSRSPRVFYRLLHFTVNYRKYIS